jgi:hypothetical protein
MRKLKYAFLGLMLFAIVGCNKTNKESSQQQATPVQKPIAQPVAPPDLQVAVPQAAEPTNTKFVESSPKPVQPEKKPQPLKKQAKIEAPEQQAKEIPVEEVATPVDATQPVVTAQVEPQMPITPAVPAPRYAAIRSGTAIQVRLQDPLDSGVNLTGDTFRAILDQNIEADGILVAPRGSILDGKISHSERSGRVQGRATMSLQLIALHIQNQPYPLQTQILSFEADSSQKKDAGKVGIGAGLGAVIGAIAGGGKGAAIGAVVGAGAGGATVMATRGNEVKLEAEQRLSFSLQGDVKILIPGE